MREQRSETPASKVPVFALRAARRKDYAFALWLYLASARPLLSGLGRWDETSVVARFAKGYKMREVSIISADGIEVGWMQVAEFADKFALEQIHLLDAYCGRGIGSKLLTELLRRAEAADKGLSLNVMHGNRARRLYERLGLSVVGQDEDKLHMRSRPEQKPARR